MSSPVEHLVVLMFENRSFDSLLGFHRRPAGSDPFAGLSGSETNPLATGETLQVAPLSGLDGYVTDPDPRHEHADAMFHLDGGVEVPATQARPNLGFAARYQTTATNARLTAAVAQQVMNVFDTRAQLPALSALVDEFRVCDAWFSSLPGPTWPNRFFAHCASSGGLYESPGDFATVWSEVGSVFNMPTIFENLSAASRSWNVYYHDIPQALGLARLHHYRGQFKHFASFLRDCSTGALPSYSFIEPGFFDAKLLNVAASDMHPIHDVRRGDALIASVYNALRANEKLWEKSMLLVLWDEHGGFHDHVPPPPTVIPDGASEAAGFRFDRLGVRVPAVVVSPWVRKGSTDSRLYDHASIPATLRRLFALPAFLTRRDARANAFDGDLLDEPRDTIPFVPTVDLSGVLPRNESELHAHHEGLLAMASRLLVPGQIAPAVTDVEAAILHAARYLDV